MRFSIDRTKLPYDAMVADASWLAPIEEEDASGCSGKAEEIQTDTLQGKEHPF